MNCFDTIGNLRKLVKGDDCCDDEFGKFLLKNECIYLLSMSKKFAPQLTMPIALNSIRNNQRYQVCKDIISELNGIPYANIKGAALSSRICGNPAYRLSGDIDLLISPNYSDKLKEILINNGFVQGRLVGDTIVPFTRKELIYQKSFSHQLAPFIKDTGKKICPFVNIDVNLDIVWGEGNFSVDMNEFLTHTENFEIHGVKISRLQPIWEFISLCMHHYKDMNSIYLIAERGLRLSEYCDIFFYLINVLPNATELTSVAKRYGVDKYVYYCIYYANEIFDDQRLSIYLNKLESMEARKLLNCYGLTEAERCEWHTPFPERLLCDRFRDKFYSSLAEDEQQKVQINRRFM